MPLVFSGIRLFSFAFAHLAGYNRDGGLHMTFSCPVLTTDRLILRPFTTADFGAIFEIFSDETVNTYLHGFRFTPLRKRSCSTKPDMRISTACGMRSA